MINIDSSSGGGSRRSSKSGTREALSVDALVVVIINLGEQTFVAI